jgi:beta-galactosidase
MNIRIKHLLLPAILAFIVLSCSTQLNDLPFERESSFNEGWKFIRADAAGAETPAFDDTSWRQLDLPHDWSIEDLPETEGVKQIGPFSEESAGGAATGHVVGGTGWYRKHFLLSKKDKGKIVNVMFDGVYMDADVWINGQHLGNHPYGYTAFSFDLTPFLKPAGEENILAVRVKNEGKNSRWYSGSGIYRKVTLVKTNTIHIDRWGAYVSASDISNEKATVTIEALLKNQSQDNSESKVTVIIVNSDKAVVGSAKAVPVITTTGMTQKFQIEIKDPKLWSPEVPHIYNAEIRVFSGRKVSDLITVKFGIRALDYSPEKGFLLNGNDTELKGGCLHHDNGPLGSAAFKTAEYRRVKIMKENGFNAIRTAHNPPSEEFLNACDELGMMVIDESFDQWQRPKNPMDYNRFFDQWWERDMEAMVLRDRNHPSVIIWSIGNEINERADSSGIEIAKKLKAKILSMDTTRPVTMAVCSFWDFPGRTWDATAPAFASLDVHGYNYQWKEYERDHNLHPERIMIGTESVPLEAFENWQMVEKYPFVIGDFVWTGMDYLGESGIGNSRLDTVKWGFLPPWPWYNANCGDISILGYKKPQMYFRDVVWRNSELEMLVHSPVPDGRKEVVSYWGWPDEQKSWTWAGHEGKPLQVSVYTRAEKVRLELNGKVIGEKVVSDSTKLTARFEVPFEPGELVAIALKNGQEVARQSLKTSGRPVSLKIEAEQEVIPATSDALAYFNVEVLDENGQLVPDVRVPVEFKIEGGYALQAVANGKPDEMNSFKTTKINTWQGRCQIILRSSGQEGEMKVDVAAYSLKSATAVVKVVEN